MSITATPTLTVAGLPVATGTAGDLAAVAGLSLTWGRSGVLEEPSPATVSVTVLDRSPAAAFASRADLIGQPILTGYTTSTGASVTNFRGRITDVVVTPRAGAVAGGGFTVTLAASSMEVDLANVLIPAGTSWPAETFAARRTRLAALLPAGMFTGGVVLPTRAGLVMVDTTGPALDTYTAAPMNAGGKSLLELLRGLFASTSPLPMVYDPALDRLTFAPRRRYGYVTSRRLTLSARLLTSTEQGGRYVATGLSGLCLDGHRLEYTGSLSRGLDGRLTRCAVSYVDQAAANAQLTTGGGTFWGGLEPVIGSRVLTVDTIHADAAAAQQLAGFYIEVASREAAAPALGQVGYSTAREPLRDAAHAAVLLGGVESANAVFIRGSWLPQLKVRPVVGVIGGTITYSDRQWRADLTPAAVAVDAAGRTWGPVTVRSALPALTLASIDSSVTAGDFAFIDVPPGAGTSTAEPYAGNPI